jgi:adenylyltransferase/sulfurtransferase
MQRYSRQTVFPEIGAAGQEKLLASRVSIIGIGALGTVIANNLCRSGVGFLRLIDRDYVELGNLQRQTLFDEDDAADETPKAVAAATRLSRVNSKITIEPVVADVNPGNIEELLKETDLVLDGTDNLEIRFLLNEACRKLRLPWIYGGVAGSAGMQMNVLEDGPCFRCFQPDMPAPGSYPTCSTIGVLNMVTGIIASMQSAEALKILIGAVGAISRRLFYLDLWKNTAGYLDVAKVPDCPVCGKGSYKLLEKMTGTYAVRLCGRGAYQIVPGRKGKISLNEIAGKLRETGEVKFSRFMLSFSDGRAAFNLFADGGAIIKNVRDENAAKSVYAEYIGL